MKQKKTVENTVFFLYVEVVRTLRGLQLFIEHSDSKNRCIKGPTNFAVHFVHRLFLLLTSSCASHQSLLTTVSARKLTYQYRHL